MRLSSLGWQWVDGLSCVCRCGPFAGSVVVIGLASGAGPAAAMVTVTSPHRFWDVVLSLEGLPQDTSPGFSDSVTCNLLFYFN